MTSVDDKLARGLTMAEVRAILRRGERAPPPSIADPAHPANAALKPVLYRYATGRRPDPGYVSGLAAALDGLHGRDPRTVAREARDDAAPGGLSGFERRYLLLRPTDPGEECRTLAASVRSLSVGPDFVALNEANLFEVDVHVAERFHRRTRSGLVRDALASLGHALMRDLGLVWYLASFAGSTGNGSFSIPFADGLALASSVPRPTSDHVPYVRLQTLRGTRLTYGGTGASGPRPPSGGCRVPLLKTFIGPDEMYPRQVALRDAIRALAARNARYLADTATALTGAGDFLRSPSPDDGLTTAEAECGVEIRSARMSREVRALFEDPAMLDAMGRAPAFPAGKR